MSKYLDKKKGSLEQSILSLWQEAAKKQEKLDPVGKEDGDIDNDGDKDSTDKYLAKRRKAISKAIKKDKKEETDLEEGPFSSKSSKIQTKVAPAVRTFKSKSKEKPKSKKEEVEEGKMSDIDQMMKDGKSAEEIAKALKMDVKSVKKVMGESYEIGTDENRKHTQDVTPGEDGEWVDAVNKKNDSMREALAKIWGMGEGNNPFKTVGGHLPSEKKKKDEDKTMTGKPMTKVNIDPDMKEVKVGKKNVR